MMYFSSSAALAASVIDSFRDMQKTSKSQYLGQVGTVTLLRDGVALHAIMLNKQKGPQGTSLQWN